MKLRRPMVLHDSPSTRVEGHKGSVVIVIDKRTGQQRTCDEAEADQWRDLWARYGTAGKKRTT